MAGTKAGGLKARDTNIRKQGEDFYRRIGAQGGKAGTTGGFWHMKYVRGNFDAIAEAGRKGGSISRRSKTEGVAVTESPTQAKKWYNNIMKKG